MTGQDSSPAGLVPRAAGRRGWPSLFASRRLPLPRLSRLRAVESGSGPHGAVTLSVFDQRVPVMSAGLGRPSLAEKCKSSPDTAP
jgi:hypothetical protein